MNYLEEMPTKTPTFVFIDGSYFCFYRYHSLLTWWKNAYPDQLHVLDNPYENDIFLNKFKTTFVSNVQKIVNHLNILHPIILVGKDCKREQIWRNK